MIDIKVWGLSFKFWDGNYGKIRGLMVKFR
jgi:hypothetical protein